MNDKKRVSSRDVAKEAGVSQATVSYILNDVKKVSIKPETRQAVMEAVRKLNYHPNEMARGMKLKRSMSIGVVTDRNVTNFYFMKTLEGIRDGIGNYSITLLFNKTDEMQEGEYIRYYNSNRVDGFIFAFASLDEEARYFFYENGIPFVKVDPVSSGSDMYEICTDHLSRIREAIEYFMSKGIKRIGYAGPNPDKVSDRRLEAFREAMESKGIKVDEGLITTSDYEDDNILAAVKKLLSSKNRPEAILAGSPRYGIVSVKGALSLDIRIPEELKIIAFGSSNFFSIAHPSISAIELPLYDMGFRAAEMLFDRMGGMEVPKMVTLPSELVIRDSS